MLSINKKHFQTLFFLLIVISLLFSRVYSLDKTARFTHDESSDLARMKNYFDDKKLTLVGPISTDNTKVFSSLTYYMLIPFAALGGFTPVAPVYGAAFYGILTAIILLIAAYKISPKKIIIVALLIITCFPLVRASRWAWNPHLLFFWASLGVLSYFYKDKIGKISIFITALCFSIIWQRLSEGFNPRQQSLTVGWLYPIC